MFNKRQCRSRAPSSRRHANCTLASSRDLVKKRQSRSRAMGSRRAQLALARMPKCSPEHQFTIAKPPMHYTHMNLRTRHMPTSAILPCPHFGRNANKGRGGGVRACATRKKLHPADPPCRQAVAACTWCQATRGWWWHSSPCRLPKGLPRQHVTLHGESQQAKDTAQSLSASKILRASPENRAVSRTASLTDHHWPALHRRKRRNRQPAPR